MLLIKVLLTSEIIAASLSSRFPILKMLQLFRIVYIVQSYRKSHSSLGKSVFYFKQFQQLAV